MKNQYKKKVKAKNKYREFIKVMNGLLQLSDREAEVLSLLMKLDAEWSPVLNETKDILSTDSRKAIMGETLINKNNLSKYVKLLKDKGLLYLNDRDGYEVTPIFMPKQTGDYIELLFILDISE
jgi:hypothetical protein